MLQALINKLFWKSPLRTQVVCIVYKETVYTPIKGEDPNGIFLFTGEMFEASFDAPQIAANVDKAKALGNPKLPKNARSVINQRLDRAIGSKVSSRWPKKGAMTCLLQWTKQQIELSCDILDSTLPDGVDYKNVAHFPLETPSTVLAEAILEEWRRRHAAGE